MQIAFMEIFISFFFNKFILKFYQANEVWCARCVVNFINFACVSLLCITNQSNNNNKNNKSMFNVAYN